MVCIYRICCSYILAFVSVYSNVNNNGSVMRYKRCSRSLTHKPEIGIPFPSSFSGACNKLHRCTENSAILDWFDGLQFKLYVISLGNWLSLYNVKSLTRGLCLCFEGSHNNETIIRWADFLIFRFVRDSGTEWYL